MTGDYMRTAGTSAAYEAAAQGASIQRRNTPAGAKDEWRESGRLNSPEKSFECWSKSDENQTFPPWSH